MSPGPRTPRTCSHPPGVAAQQRVGQGALARAGGADQHHAGGGVVSRGTEHGAEETEQYNE